MRQKVRHFDQGRYLRPSTVLKGLIISPNQGMLGSGLGLFLVSNQALVRV